MEEEVVKTEIVDLDEIDQELENEEHVYNSDGVNMLTGEYNPSYDAFYPNFSILAQVEREIFGKRSH